MIQIKKTNLDKLAKQHYTDLQNQLDFSNIKATTLYKSKNEYQCFIQYIENNIESIISDRPEKSREHIKNISLYGIVLKKNRTKNIKPQEQLENEFINSLVKIFNYKSKIRKVKFAQDIDLISCPYCNREYIFQFCDDKKSKELRVLANLDHYYDKATYPYLALSFFNLVPSCYTCNSKFKTISDFYKHKHLHPYEDDFNKKAKFVHFFNIVKDETKECPIFSKERITIKLIPNNISDKETINTIKTFRLNELYNKHTDIIIELLQKREIYSDSYIDDLFYQYEGILFNNREDLLRLITCGYIADEDIDKRPLSKLIKDISEQLEFI